MSRPLSVALAGLGTVGGGVLKLLRDNADIVAARAGRPIAVTAVSARDRNRDRGFSIAGLRWYDDPVALASDPGVDVVVELIGGSIMIPVWLSQMMKPEVLAVGSKPWLEPRQVTPNSGGTLEPNEYALQMLRFPYRQVFGAPRDTEGSKFYALDRFKATVALADWRSTVATKLGKVQP